MPTTIVDFWRMVWQVKSELIIKVTREVEGGVLKCHRYWPDPNAEPPQKKVVLGQLTVEFMSADHSDAWIVRSFKVKKGNTERIIQMFSYEAWPDHGVPLTTREFLGFRKAVKVSLREQSFCTCALTIEFCPVPYAKSPRISGFMASIVVKVKLTEYIVYSCTNVRSGLNVCPLPRSEIFRSND